MVKVNIQPGVNSQEASVLSGGNFFRFKSVKFSVPARFMKCCMSWRGCPANVLTGVMKEKCPMSNAFFCSPRSFGIRNTETWTDNGLGKFGKKKRKSLANRPAPGWVEWPQPWSPAMQRKVYPDRKEPKVGTETGPLHSTYRPIRGLGMRGKSGDGSLEERGIHPKTVDSRDSIVPWCEIIVHGLDPMTPKHLCACEI